MFLRAASAGLGRGLPGNRRFYGKIRVGEIILDKVAGYFRNWWQVWSGTDILRIETALFFKAMTVFFRLIPGTKKIKNT